MSQSEISSYGRAQRSFSRPEEIDEFIQTLSAYERGEIDADAWKSFRLLRGAYGQRQEGDLSMLRVKLPQGIANGRQLRALGEASEKYSRGWGHITTRQNIQFHFVKLHEVASLLAVLEPTGITSREACGNSVRNVTACQHSGVSKQEVFDVTPYADAFTRYFLGHPLSSSLPRKFKVGFEGCAGEDHASIGIHDLGFRAVEKDGKRGFHLAVGGGTSILCRTGWVLHEFLPAEEMLNVSEAVVRVFHKKGDRLHRKRNRMKFLIEEMGWENFRAEVEKEHGAFVAEGGAALPFVGLPPEEVAPVIASRRAPPSVEWARATAASAILRGPGIQPIVGPSPTDFIARSRWKKSNVRAQKQEGFVEVTVTSVLGDLTGRQFVILAELAEAFGDGTVRFRIDQNLTLRWISEGSVDALFDRLAAAGLGQPDAGSVADVTSCPGAEACKLAVTQSRGLGQVIGDLLRARPDLIDLAPELRVKISGCPHGCGQHHVAGIGFQGSTRKIAGKMVPQYFVMIGGGSGPEGARFGRLIGKVPARKVTFAVERLLAFYAAHRLEGETATAFFARIEPAKAKAAIAELEALSEADAREEDFIDLGEQQGFVLHQGVGECAA